MFKELLPPLLLLGLMIGAIAAFDGWGVAIVVLLGAAVISGLEADL